MKHRKIFTLAVILTVILTGFDATAIGPGLVTGPEAREWFERHRDEDCWMFVNFENIETGILSKLKILGVDLGVTLNTTEFRWPLNAPDAEKNTPVVVLPYNFVKTPPNHRLMGVRQYNIPDGQSKYEIRFDYLMDAVGLLRKWNKYSITRFYDANDNLIIEHRNTADEEFVGYIAAFAGWPMVRRIEFDGAKMDPESEDNMLYQVGEVDDLFYSRPSLHAEIDGVPSWVKMGDTIMATIIIRNLGNYRQDNIRIRVHFYSHEQERDIDINLTRNFEPNEHIIFEFVLPITTRRKYDEPQVINVILYSPSGDFIYTTTKRYTIRYYDSPVPVIIQLLLMPM